MKKKIKAVLFDMDGVLIDAKEWHYEALNQALNVFGTSISRYDHLTTFDGLPTRNKLKILSETENFPTQLHKFVNTLKQKYTMQHVHNKCSPNFIHEYALSRLKHEGYKIAVCSNSIRNSIITMMELSGLMPYLDTIWSAEDVSEAKPNPAIYIKAIEHFQLTPEEVVIVEDNENGIKAARASGGHCLAVRDVSEVNFENITQFIKKTENIGEKCQ
ncbi:MAG: HAD family hydrolase [Gammaproteobacteria bacterium]